MSHAPWRRSRTREGRNEQRKLHGALFNALAITLIVSALVAPFINPNLAGVLALADRIAMAVAGWLFRLLARRPVRDIWKTNDDERHFPGCDDDAAYRIWLCRLGAGIRLASRTLVSLRR